jgi:hypothetical protein
VTTSYDDLPRQTSTVERVVTVLLMVGLAVLVPLAALVVGAVLWALGGFVAVSGVG